LVDASSDYTQRIPMDKAPEETRHIHAVAVSHIPKYGPEVKRGNRDSKDSPSVKLKCIEHLEILSSVETNRGRECYMKFFFQLIQQKQDKGML